MKHNLNSCTCAQLADCGLARFQAKHLLKKLEKTNFTRWDDVQDSVITPALIHKLQKNFVLLERAKRRDTPSEDDSGEESEEESEYSASEEEQQTPSSKKKRSKSDRDERQTPLRKKKKSESDSEEERQTPSRKKKKSKSDSEEERQTPSRKKNKSKSDSEEERQTPSKKKKPTPRKIRIILLGNPGVGKSTILNTLIGSNTFRSGASAAIGLTRVVGCYQINRAGHERTYVDTPGLDEYDAKQQMAMEIQQNAIIPGEPVVLVFVCAMSAGRLDNNFIKTVEIIMTAFSEPHPFTVVFNQVGPEVLKVQKEKIAARHSHIFAGFGLMSPSYIWVPMHAAAYGQNATMLVGEARDAVLKIEQRRPVKTGGIKIQLARIKKLNAIKDRDYEKPFEKLKGEESFIAGDFRGADDEPCEKRFVFTKKGDPVRPNKKAHCEHCMWYKVLLSRKMQPHRASKDSDDCLYCVNS